MWLNVPPDFFLQLLINCEAVKCQQLVRLPTFIRHQYYIIPAIGCPTLSVILEGNSRHVNKVHGAPLSLKNR